MEPTLNEKIEHARKLIRENVAKYPKCSFAFSGGKDSAVLVHLAVVTLGGHARENMRIDAVLSDTEFDETHDYITEFVNRYSLQQNLNRHFYLNDPLKPEEASKDNKTEKFKEVLADVGCWFSGIRRDEGATRTEIEDVEELDGLVKVNPIAAFTEKDVWRYLALYAVPVNKAYRHGYRSLSCRLSSVPEKSGDEPERGGRWANSKNCGLECGIHSKSLRK